MPEDSRSVAARVSGGERGGEEEVGDGEDRASRVSSNGSVGAQLFEVARGSDARFFFKLARCSLLGLFAFAQEAAGQGQVIFEGVDSATYDEGVEGVVDNGEGDYVDRDRDGEGLSHGVSITYLRRVDIKCADRLSSS